VSASVPVLLEALHEALGEGLGEEADDVPVGVHGPSAQEMDVGDEALVARAGDRDRRALEELSHHAGGSWET
jgi:hypothetical protein